jgi:hypothetical protein
VERTGRRVLEVRGREMVGMGVEDLARYLKFFF